jgi:hypothetical protein
MADIQQKKETLKKPLRRSRLIPQENENFPQETSSGIPLHYIQQRYRDVRAKMAESEAKFEKRNRVTTTTIILMVSVAGFYDLVQGWLDLVPLIGWILSSFVGIASWLTFYIWTSTKGWGMSDTAKKFIASKVLPAIGCIGLLNIGPEITAGVIFTLMIVKAEDTLYNTTGGRVDTQVLEEGVGFLNYLKKLV